MSTSSTADYSGWKLLYIYSRLVMLYELLHDECNTSLQFNMSYSL